MCTKLGFNSGSHPPSSSVVLSSNPVSVSNSNASNELPECFIRFLESYFEVQYEEDSSESPPFIVEGSKADNNTLSSMKGSFVKAVSETMRWKLALPVREIVTHFVKDMILSKHSHSAEKLFGLGHGKEPGYAVDLQEFFLALHEFDKSGNAKPIRIFFDNQYKALAAITSPPLSEVTPILLMNITLLKEMFDPSNVSMLKKKALYFFQEELPRSADFHFQIAVNCFSYLEGCLGQLTILTGLHMQSELNQKDVVSKQGDSSRIFSEMAALILKLKKESLTAHSDLNQGYFTDCLLLFKDLESEFRRTHCVFDKSVLTILASDEIDAMRTVIESGEVEAFCDSNYVRNNKDSYENFLPLIKENKEYLSGKCAFLIETSQVLSNFYLYLKCGDLIRLQSRLDNECSSVRSFRKILIDEVLKFSKHIISDPILLKKVIEFLQSPEGEPVMKYRMYLNVLSKFFMKMDQNIHALIDVPFQLAEQNSKFLFPIASYGFVQKGVSKKQKPSQRKVDNNQNLHRKNSKKTVDFAKMNSNLCTASAEALEVNEASSVSTSSEVLPAVKTSIDSPKVNSEALETKTGITSAQVSVSSSVPTTFMTTSNAAPLAASPPAKLPDPFPDFLEPLQQTLSIYFKQLQSGCKGLEADVAIQNAEHHFTALIRAINRFSRISGYPLERTELFSFVADCVQHGNLGVEQLLTAFIRESNGFKNQKEINSSISHNLVEILHGCKFTHKGFSPLVRQWISSINQGELCAREVALYSLEGNFAQRMLFKAWHYSTEVDAFGPKEIAEDLVAYMKNIGAFYGSFFTLFQLEKQKRPKIDPAKIADLQNAFAKLGFRLEQEICSLTIKKEPSVNNFGSGVLAIAKEIRSEMTSLHKAAPSIGIKASYNNILSNLLVRLESELQTHGKLQPSEATLHYNNVLLLNQMILELFLKNQIDSRDVLIKEEIAPHDLLSMVKALGVDEKMFSSEEQDFLKRGRHILSLCRYPSSYSSQHQGDPLKVMHPINDVLNKAKMHTNHSLRDRVEAGFSYAGKIGTVISQVQNAVEEDVRLLLSIQKKILFAFSQSQ